MTESAKGVPSPVIPAHVGESFDFDDASAWGMSEPSRETGKSVLDLSGSAATWFVNRAAAQGISAAVESPEIVHGEYCAYVEKDVTTRARELLTALRADIDNMLACDADDDDAYSLGEDVRIIANSSRTSVSARLGTRADLPRGEYATASVSFRIDGPLKSALMAVAPAAQKRSN